MNNDLNSIDSRVSSLEAQIKRLQMYLLLAAFAGIALFLLGAAGSSIVPKLSDSKD